MLERKIDEPKAKSAAELYYGRFGTRRSLTVHEAAARLGITGTEVHLYITDHVEAGLGMPENRSEALGYLKKIRGLPRLYS